MAGTSYSALLSAARLHLNAQRGKDASLRTDKFWSDDELLSIALRGTTDMWAAILDLHQEHYLTIADGTNDTADVSLQSGNDFLSGVPLDCFRVYLIEPRDISSTGVQRDVAFIPRAYNHPEFINARAWAGQTPSNGLNIFYDIIGAGAPNAAPSIRIAPTVTITMPLRFAYFPSLNVQSFNLQSLNPIPGESDHAIIAWIVAYAMGKETADKTPNAGWLAVYATEKQSLLKRMVPRQEQEPVYIDGLFDNYWSY